MTLLFRLGWRNLLRQRWRSALGLATVALGVAGLALAGGFIEDVFDQLGEATIHSQLGHIQITRSGYREGAGRPNDFLIAHSGALRSRLAADPSVVATMGRLAFSGLLTTDRREHAIEGEGVEPGSEAGLGTYLTMLEGRALADRDHAGVVVGEGVARRLGVQVGDRVTLVAPTVDGSMNSADLEVVGVFRTFSKDFDERAVRVALPAAQELLQIDSVNVLVVQLGQTRQTQAVAAALATALAADGLELRTWEQLSDFYANTRAMYVRQFGILRAIALVLIALSVLNSVNMTVYERTAEFGTMRALGNRVQVVARTVVVEAFLLGLLGAAAGAVIALFAGALASWIGIPMPPPPNAEAGYTARILLTPGVLGVAAGIGLASAVVGAILPARRAARQPIVDALRHAI